MKSAWPSIFFHFTFIMSPKHFCNNTWLLAQILHPFLWIPFLWFLFGESIGFIEGIGIVVCGFFYSLPLYWFCLQLLKFIKLLEVDIPRKLLLWVSGLAMGLILLGLIPWMFEPTVWVYQMILLASIPGFLAGVIATLINYWKFTQAVQSQDEKEPDNI